MTSRLSRSANKQVRHVRLTLEELEPRQLLSTVADAAFSLLNDRVAASQIAFYVYQDADSAFNHGFPSGKFASNSDPALLNAIAVNTAVVNDPNAANGASTDPNALDRDRGTVLSVSFPNLTGGQFAGLNFVDPQGFSAANPSGIGYDLTGATRVVFEARTLTPATVRFQFGVGGRVTDQNNFFSLTTAFTTVSIPLNTLRDANTNVVSPPDLANVHILFTIATNDPNSTGASTILLDNIHFEPRPTDPLRHLREQNFAIGMGLSFPVGTETFGVVPVVNPPSTQPIPPDQVIRNLSTTYETTVTALSLLQRGATADLANARELADTLVYALHHEIRGDGTAGQGDPLPTAPDGSAGLHNGYGAGDLALFNDQTNGDTGKQGQIRLAGFAASPTSFYLVLDGATGGNNAFASLTLTAAYRRFGDARYLDAAREIDRWIVGTLADTSGTGYGGYFIGYPDRGLPKIRQTGKSVENNADIFAAFTELAAIEAGLGNAAAAADWTMKANAAGDFVMAMYDPSGPRFNAGTAPVGTQPRAGIDPTGPQRGNDVINRFDFLDSNSFVILALASAPRYRNQIDWRGPVQYLLGHFAQSVTVAGEQFQGFSIVTQPTASPDDNRPNPGPNGIAWEFAGQAVATMRFVDRLYGDTRFEALANYYLAQIAHAQAAAPFADGRGLVAATVQDGAQLPPLNQGLTTPFQFIPERVGIAATVWAGLADTAENFLAPRFVAAPLPDPVDTFVPALYTDFLGRSAGAAEVPLWRQLLVGGGAGPVAAGVARSHESLTRIVAAVYDYFLGRQAGSAEAAVWVDQVEHHGLSVEGLVVAFVSGPEFTASHATNDGFIRSLGTLLLCRNLSDGEVSSLDGVVSANGRTALAAAFVSGGEFRTNVVQTLYGTRPAGTPPRLPFVPNLLHRPTPATAAEADVWERSGLDVLGLTVAIASGAEYFRRSAAPTNPHFIDALYTDALARPASGTEQNLWGNLFITAGAAPVVNGVARSAEAAQHTVASWYSRFLGRRAGSGETTGWANLLLAGATEEQVLGGFLSSGEFYNRAQRLTPSGGGDERFVQALYLLLLERPASAGEVGSWLGTVAGAGRQAVALTFLSLAEFRGVAVRGVYLALLHRPAADAEANSWVNSPLDLGTIRRAIASGLEFNLGG